MIDVIESKLVTVSYGQGHEVLGQLTKCKWKNIVFFVRENCNATSTFLMTSNARMGFKADKVPDHYQSLELCAPNSFKEQLKKIVYNLDPLKRPVLFNRKFTFKWADKQFSEPDRCILSNVRRFTGY